MTMQKFHLMAAVWLAGAAAGAGAQTAGTTVKSAPAGANPAAVTATPAANGARSAAASAPVLVVKPAASAPVPVKRQTRPLTAAEKRESAASPGELRPERTITPQLTIPLGKTPPDSARTATGTGTPPGTTGKPSGAAVNDSAGRCAAIVEENERAMCREAAGLGKPKK